MSTTQNIQPLISKEDHDLLLNYAKQADATQLKEKIKQVKVVSKDELPHQVVRVNSSVVVRDKMARRNFIYQVAVPQHDLAHQTTLSPIGIALLGMQKGQDVSIPHAKGRKYYLVMEVTNPVG
jgi:regulator of nucleoside diphosphate kinase